MFGKKIKMIFTTLILWCGILGLRLQAIPDPLAQRSTIHLSNDELRQISQEADATIQQFNKDFINQVLFDVQDTLNEQQDNESRLKKLPVIGPYKAGGISVGVYNKDIDKAVPLVANMGVEYFLYKNWHSILTKEFINTLNKNNNLVLDLSRQLLKVENDEAEEIIKIRTRKEVCNKLKDFLHATLADSKKKIVLTLVLLSIAQAYVFSSIYASIEQNSFDEITRQAFNVDNNQDPEICISATKIFGLIAPIPLPINYLETPTVMEEILHFFSIIPQWSTDWRITFLKRLVFYTKIYSDLFNHIIEKIGFEIFSKHYPELEQLIHAEQTCTLEDEKTTLLKEIKNIYTESSSDSFYSWLSFKKAKYFRMSMLINILLMSPKLISFAKWLANP